MTNRTLDVLVVGAGVSGLTTAVCLAEAGLAVTVVAERPPRETTSAAAGAIWGPHLVESSDRADRWGWETLLVLRELAAGPGTGVRIGTGVTATRAPHGSAAPQETRALAQALAQPGSPVSPGSPAPPPGTAAQAGPAAGAPGNNRPGDAAHPGEFRPCGPGELPAGFTEGWRYAAPLVEMPVYLDYLRARLEDAGGRLQAGTVTSLTAAAREAGARAVVNCTGTGARALAGDPEVTPVRGQVVVAENPGIREFFIGLPDAAHDVVYVFPHGDTVVLGGTQAAGEQSQEPDPADAARILRDCAAVEPRLRTGRVLAHRVGLRPVRPHIRVEAEQAGRPRPGGGDLGHHITGEPVVVHNYGHGGAGITLSWGCAREAAALVRRGFAG